MSISYGRRWQVLAAIVIGSAMILGMGMSWEVQAGEQRERMNTSRIADGIRDKELSTNEARMLRRDRRRMNRTQRNAASAGQTRDADASRSQPANETAK